MKRIINKYQKFQSQNFALKANFLFFLLLVIQSQLSAQYSISYSDSNGVNLANNDVHACQEVIDSIHAVRVIIEDDAADNTKIEIDFPTGMSYLTGSLVILDQIGGITVTTISSSSSIEIVLNPSDLNAGDEITFGYARYANCSAINHQNNGGTFKDIITVSGDAGTVVENNPALSNYDLLVPAISLFNEGAITTTVGSTVTREVSIVNGGLGFLKSTEFSINDQTGTITTSLTTANGTTLTPTTVGSIHTYDLGSSVISQYGNGDDKLDNGEEIILTRTYEVLSCFCPSSYEVNWNCEGQCEESISLPQETIIANTVPKLVVNMPDVDEDVCFDGSNSYQTGSAVIQVVKVENTGTGAAVNFSLTMSNYNPGSGRGRHYYSDEAWVVKNEAGAVINTMSNILSLGTLNYWQADCSVTSESTDMRQDAVGLVIEPGESVYVEIPVYYSNLLCPHCPKGPSWHMFNGSFQYEDICENNTYVIPRSPFFNRRHNFQRYDVEMPTDVHDDECFDIDINYNRVQNFVGQDEAGGGSVTAVVDLNNTGLTYQGGSTLEWGDFTVNVTEVGGFLRIEMPVNVAENGQIVVPVCVDCDLIGGGAVSIDFWHEVHYSDSCGSDPIVQECKTEIFVVHCPWPCPEGGATPLDFDLERITIGLQDVDDNGVPDNNNQADLDDIELHRTVNGDQVKGTWDIHVYPNTVGPNAGLPFQYVYVKFDTYKVNQACSPAEATRTSYFDAEPNAVATITPGDGSPVITCTVSPTVDSDGIATYDLSNCKADWYGGDKIILEAIFTVNAFVSKTGESLYVADNECYSSYIPNPGAADQHYCDFYNDYMNIYNIWHSPYMPATQQILGCDNSANAYLRQYINIQAWNVWFPNEYRNFVIFDQYIVDWPSYMVYRPGSATFAGQSIPDSDVTQTGTQLIFNNLRQFYQPYGGSILPPDEIHNNALVKWSVDPTCDAEPSFISRFTAVSLGNGVNTPSSNWDSHVGCGQKYSGWATFTYDAPIPFISGGGETQPTTNETCWEINLNNSSNSQDAENSWFYFEDNNNTLGTISLFEGGTQIYPNGNGFFQLGTNANSSTTEYTVCADIESCGDINLELSMGYHCSTYPSSLSNSDCVDSIILGGDPQDAEVQVILDSYPLDPNNVCEEQVVILGLTSAQAAYLDNSYVEITLPLGVTFVGDIEIEYPSGSGNWQSVSYSVSGGNYIINIEDHSGIGPEGLPGTSDDPNELNREINLRFVVTYPQTGEGIILSSYGENPCGDPAQNNGVTVNTADLDPLFPDVVTDASICPGDTYAWQDSTYAIAGTYEIVGYNALGCAYFNVLNLEVYETFADIEGDTSLTCDILSVDLTALPAGFSYSWSSGESSQVISATLPDTYFVSITDDNGCITVDSIIVTQDIIAPEVEVINDEICIGEDGVITASGGGTYEWPNGETTESITVSPTATTSYIVTVTTENGCESTAEATVTVNPLPNNAIIKHRDITCSPANGYIYATVNYPNVTQYLNGAQYISGGAGCGDQYLEINGDDPYSVVGENIAGILTPGVSYNLNIKYKKTGTGTTTLRMNYYNSGWTYLSNTTVTLPNASTWTDFTLSGVAPANAANTHIGLVVHNGAQVDYDCVELEVAGGAVLFENSFEVTSPYQWEGPNGYAGSSRGVYANVPGIYSVTITDPNTGCVNTNQVEVFEYIDPPGGEITSDGQLTCDQTEVNLTVSSPVTDATFLWDNGLTEATITVSDAGTYSVTITDPFNKCTTVVEYEVLEDIEEPEVSASNDGPITCTLPSVTLTALPAGLSYEWSNGSTEESPQVSVADTYTVTVTDVNGCTSTASTEVLEDNDPPTIILDDIEICIGEDGTITASGGVSYSWPTGESSESIIVNPASTTDYTVTVTDTNGCTDSSTATVTVNPLPNADIFKLRDIACTPNTGYIRTVVSYPDVPDNLNNSEYISGDAACGDQHIHTIGDSPVSRVGDKENNIITGGEMYHFSFQYRAFGAVETRARITYYNSSNNSLGTSLEYLPLASSWTNYTYSLQAPADATHIYIGLYVGNGATADYDCVVLTDDSGTILFEESYEVTSPFSWEGPNGYKGASRGIYITEPGTYYLTVTDPDTGCQNSSSVEVFEFKDPPGGEITSNGPLTCAQTQVDLTATSPVADATFEWSTGGTNATETVTETGTYEVTITDPFNGCETVVDIEVTEDLAEPNATASNDGPITCADPAVTITALPAGLSYEWPDGSTSQTLDVTIGGEYVVTVTDVNGCSATASSEVIEDIDPPTIVLENVDICIGEDATLIASGGVSYVWSSGETTPSITMTPSATTDFTVTVTDTNGCTDSATATVTVNPLPDNSITIYRELNCVPSTGFIYANQAYPNVISYMDKSVYVQGSAACENQHIQITGSTPYSVVGQNLANVVTAGNSYDFSFQYKLSGTGLTRARIVFYGPGYSFISQELVTLTEAANWTNHTITRTAPAGATNVHIGLLVTNPATMDYDCVEFKETGQANIFEDSFETETPYQWEGPSGPAGHAKGIYITEPGTYYLTITDPVTGCVSTNSVEMIDNRIPPDGAVSNDGPLTCADTEVTLTASSSTGGVGYEWSNGATTATTEVSTVGTYSVTITDLINGCTTVLETVVTEDVTPPTPTADNDGPLTCNDPTVTITALPAGLVYEWPDGSTNQTLDVTTGGEYIVTVTDVNGCTATASSTVLEDLDPPVADAGEDASQCDGESMQLQASGGETYQWSPAANLDNPNISNPTAITNVTTTYTVTVTSVNGCTATDEVVISIDEVTLQVDSDATTCEDECTGTITVEVNHAIIGDFNLSYSFEGSTVSLGPFTTSVIEISNLCEGEYSDFAVDGVNNGCSAFWAGPITISEETVEWEHVTHTDDVSDCSGICNGSFTVDANFGMTGEFMVSYTFDGVVTELGPYNFAGDILIDDLCAGSYTDITITSTETGCYSVWPDNIEILEPFPIAEIVQINNDVCQEEQGSTIISISGGTSPYTITWTSTDGTHSGTSILNNPGNIELDGLIGGNTYCIEVEDANGCEAP